MLVVDEAMRRDFIVRLAEDCELALIRADNAGRSGTVRERLSMAALCRADAALYAAGAFTWANAEVVA